MWVTVETSLFKCVLAYSHCPPYEQLQTSYWKYEGANTSASWDCELDPGTRVVFQVVDNQGIKDTGFLVTVAVCALCVRSVGKYSSLTDVGDGFSM